jgi:uncharacterized protein
MKIQYKNYYFTGRDDINIIYDFERNNIMSYPKTVNISRVLEMLNEKKLEEKYLKKLPEVDLDIYDYIKNNIIDTDKRYFDSFEFLKRNDFGITSASLMITQNCNLRCTYCYGGESGMYNSNTPFMSKDIAKKAIKNLVNNNKIGNEININFFGGEPLMNFELIKFTVNECINYPEYKFVFSITTNATLINEEIALFFRTHEFRVMISIDGYEKTHNYHRKMRNGKGSYSIVVKKIELLIKNGVEFRIRATLDHRFYNEYFEINDFLTKLGSDRVTISRLVSYNDNELSFPLNIEDIKEERKFIERYLKKALSDVFDGKFPRNFPYLSHFKKIVFAEKSLMNCGAYEGGTAISSDGKYYPCHRFVGMNDFDFGDVDNGIDEEKIKKQLKSLDEHKKKCLKCFGKYICQRSCLRDIAKSGGKYIQHDEKYCEILKETVDDALISYYQILTNKPDFFNTKLIYEKEIH